MLLSFTKPISHTGNYEADSFWELLRHTEMIEILQDFHN